MSQGVRGRVKGLGLSGREVRGVGKGTGQDRTLTSRKLQSADKSLKRLLPRGVPDTLILCRALIRRAMDNTWDSLWGALLAEAEEALLSKF